MDYFPHFILVVFILFLVYGGLISWCSPLCSIYPKELFGEPFPLENSRFWVPHPLPAPRQPQTPLCVMWFLNPNDLLWLRAFPSRGEGAFVSHPALGAVAADKILTDPLAGRSPWCHCREMSPAWDSLCTAELYHKQTRLPKPPEIPIFFPLFEHLFAFLPFKLNLRLPGPANS